MVGCLLTLALLTAIVVRCIWVARHAKTRQEGLVCIGVAGMVIFQVIVNVGMCLFVMPVIGLTLPFISYGGSSLLMLFISMGLVSGVQGRSKPGSIFSGQYSISFEKRRTNSMRSCCV